MKRTIHTGQSVLPIKFVDLNPGPFFLIFFNNKNLEYKV